MLGEVKKLGHSSELMSWVLGGDTISVRSHPVFMSISSGPISNDEESNLKKEALCPQFSTLLLKPGVAMEDCSCIE
jgi:hypothetical protein